MYTISDTVTRKFVNSIDLNDLEIETDDGWQPIISIHKTVPYQVWLIETLNGLKLECADDHIVFDENLNEIFVKNIVPYKTKILTKNGSVLVTNITIKDIEENMFDVSVNHPNHRFYTNGILSHNTTILNALSYVLFGSALTNIKKDNLINKVNGKNMLTTLTFEKNGNQYRIERGRRPNIMKFFVNDKEKDVVNIDESQGDVRETQKDIEDLLSMSHSMFKHILALNTYAEPFLSMRASEQREIIEQLLGITQLSEKAENLKEEIRKIKELIFQENSNIEAIKKSNEKIEQSINSLRIKQNAWNNQKNKDLEKIEKSINELKQVNIDKELDQHGKLKVYYELHAQLKSLNKERATLENAVEQAEKTVKKYLKEIENLKNNHCHACEQKILGHKHEEMYAKSKKSHDEAVIYLKKVCNTLKTVVEEIQKIGELNERPNVFYETVEEALRHQNNLTTFENALENKKHENDPYQDQIEELQQTALQTTNYEYINNLNTIREHQEFLLKLLTNKDSFIRKKIIDQNLTYLNNRLCFYLDKMGLPHQVQFKNDLTVEISQLGQDLDFDNLSRGERARLILSLSWSFRDVWESLYQNINLLFIDEWLDNGLDSAGVENGLSILKTMARERHKNVFLISHREELIGRVNNLLKVVKNNGFTSFDTDLEIL